MNSIYRARKIKPKRKKWNRGMIGFAIFFLLLGTPLYIPLLIGLAPWSVHTAAAVFQCIGSAVACLWGAWLFREEKR